MITLPKIFKKQRPTSSIKPIVLLVLDGYGVAQPSHGNAIELARKPVMDRLLSEFPNGKLIASGEAVGLPANEVGNTEVGHLTLGAGRVIDQDLKRIGNAIVDGTFYENEAFLKAIQHTRQNNSHLHIAGLIGSGNVHSSLSHLLALINLCKLQNLHEVYFHLFTDGRDSPPQEALVIIQKIEERLTATGVGYIATISGRYYAMDRDRRWDRTEKAYLAMVEGKGFSTDSAAAAVQQSYDKKMTDEFIEPTIIVKDGHPVGTVHDNDAFIFYNFRVDRPRQLTMAFVLPNFETLNTFEFGYVSDTENKAEKVNFGSTFRRTLWPKNLFFVTMTEYQKNIPVSAIAYPPFVVSEALPVVLARYNLNQMHMAESEKERFITYYFDGLREKAVDGEYVNIVPSPKVPTYDKKPEMSVYSIVEEFNKAISLSKYHFFVINFANADMVAHSGNLRATITAIEHVDKAVGEIAETVLFNDGTLIVTADHGNAEELITFPTSSFFFTSNKGSTNTDHSNNPVPVIVVNRKYQMHPINISQGGLSDIAPTILAMMNIPIPAEMTGRNLLAEVNI